MAVEKNACVIKSSDMPEEQQQVVCDIVLAAFAKFSDEWEVARFVKKEMDGEYGPLWHVFVVLMFQTIAGPDYELERDDNDGEGQQQGQPQQQPQKQQE